MKMDRPERLRFKRELGLKSHDISVCEWWIMLSPNGFHCAAWNKITREPHPFRFDKTMKNLVVTIDYST